jgi:hypothetical protein
MRKHLKSPFILATASGIGALVADVVWLTGELSTRFEIISETTYLIIRFGILIALVLSIITAVLAIRKYLKKGYVRAEHQIEVEHKEFLKHKKINKNLKKQVAHNND